MGYGVLLRRSPKHFPRRRFSKSQAEFAARLISHNWNAKRVENARRKVHTSRQHEPNFDLGAKDLLQISHRVRTDLHAYRHYGPVEVHDTEG
jgi:hypothetical protein